MNNNVVDVNEALGLKNPEWLPEGSKIFEPLTPMIELIMGLNDFDLNDTAIELYTGIIEGIFSAQLRARLINELAFDFKKSKVAQTELQANREELIRRYAALIDELKPSENKRKLLDAYINQINSLFNEAIDIYGGISFVLPIKLDEGAQVPTYAHDSDAAADLYAADDVTLPAHSLSNMVRTGVHIALPENWTAFIVPRSSIGMKTGLRLSNSVGVIDQQYRGALGVIYDNTSDSDYTIKQGDRIAQMFIMPTYRFKAQIVDELDETERGNGGYGSTGK